MSASVAEFQKQCAALRAKFATGETLRDVDPSGLLSIPPLRPVRSLKAHSMRAIALAWHPDSKHLVSIDQAGAAILWDTASSTVRQYVSRNFCTSVAIAPTDDAEDNTTVAIGGMDNVISICDMSLSLKSGEMLSMLPASGESHEGFVSKLAFLGSKDSLVSAGGDELRLWSVSKGVTNQVLHGHTKDTLDVAVHDAKKDGTSLVASSSMDGTVRLWDLRTGLSSHVFNCGPMKGKNGSGSEPSVEVGSVAFFPTGDAVVAGCSDGAVRIFDLRSYSMMGELSASPQAAAVSAVTGIAVSKSGRAIYTSHEDATIGTWDPLGSGKPRTWYRLDPLFHLTDCVAVV